jgi:hypothetical protein
MEIDADSIDNLEKLRNQILVELTPEEINEIIVRNLTTTSGGIFFHTSGPEEIMNKIREISDRLFEN